MRRGADQEREWSSSDGLQGPARSSTRERSTVHHPLPVAPGPRVVSAVMSDAESEPHQQHQAESQGDSRDQGPTADSACEPTGLSSPQEASPDNAPDAEPEPSPGTVVVMATAVELAADGSGPEGAGTPHSGGGQGAGTPHSGGGQQHRRKEDEARRQHL